LRYGAALAAAIALLSAVSSWAGDATGSQSIQPQPKLPTRRQKYAVRRRPQSHRDTAPKI